MTKSVHSELQPEIIEYLKIRGHTVMVTTVDENGQPDIDLISWVLAVDKKTIRFVVGSAIPGAINMRRDKQVTLQILGKDQVYAIKGTASVIKEKMEATKWPTTLIEMIVGEVRENMYGAGMVSGDVPVRREERVDTLHKEFLETVYTEMESM